MATLMTFDGGIPWDEFLTHFEAVAVCNGWNAIQKGFKLASTLRGSALNVLDSISVGSRLDYNTLVSKLDETFSLHHLTPYFAKQLLSVVQDEDESLQQLSIRIETLTMRAFPDCSMESLQTLMVQTFTKAITDFEIRKDVTMATCKTLNEALQYAVRSEAFYKFVMTSKSHKQFQLPVTRPIFMSISANVVENRAVESFKPKCNEKNVKNTCLLSMNLNEIKTISSSEAKVKSDVTSTECNDKKVCATVDTAKDCEIRQMLQRWADENSDYYLSTPFTRNADRTLTTSDNGVKSTPNYESAEFTCGHSELVTSGNNVLESVEIFADQCENKVPNEHVLKECTELKCIENGNDKNISVSTFVDYSEQVCATQDGKKDVLPADVLNNIDNSECSFDVIVQGNLMDFQESTEHVCGNSVFKINEKNKTYGFDDPDVFANRHDRATFRTALLKRQENYFSVPIETEAWIYLMWHVMMTMLACTSVNLVYWKVRHKWPPPELWYYCQWMHYSRLLIGLSRILKL